MRTNSLKKTKEISSIGEIMNYQIYNNNPSVKSNVQKELFERALHGLKGYSSKEIYEMNSAKKNRILKVHNKTKDVINKHKQEKIIELTNSLFKNLFPNSELTESLLNNSIIDPKFYCNIPLKDLKISKESLIDLLIEEKILPSNYHTL